MMKKMNLTSKKLVALISGLVAVVAVTGMAAFGSSGKFDLDKPLLAVTTITLTGIGAQAVLDSKKPVETEGGE